MILATLIRRDFLQLVHSVHGAGPLFLALCGSSALLLWLLQRAEGTTETFPALWGLAAAVGMPFLAAVAASRGFTQDRESGMMRLMFSTPVRARGWVLGKVGAAWLLCMTYLLGLALAAWVLMRWLLPTDAQLPSTWIGFSLVVLTLAIQALFWSSLGTLASLLSRSSASTFLLSLLACLTLPPLVERLAALLTPNTESQWPWFPLQAAVYDSAGGFIDIRLLVGCLLISGVLIYIAGLAFDALRLCATAR